MSFLSFKTLQEFITKVIILKQNGNLQIGHFVIVNNNYFLGRTN